MRRGWLLLIVVGASAVATTTTDVRGAETSHDGSGRILLDGRPVFPIVLSRGPSLGSRTPWGTDGLDEVVRAGVTFLKTGPVSGVWTPAAIENAIAWNLAASARGVNTWVALGDVAAAPPGSSRAELLAEVVRTLARGPGNAAIGMWKGADEPLLNLLHPHALRYPYCRVTSRGDPSWCAGERALDPGHLWVTIQGPRGARSKLASYSSVTDVHGVDVYPVRFGKGSPDLHQVGRWTRTIASVSGGAPVWATLQICAKGSGDQRGNYLMPTRAQERYMLYDAILNGARAVAFYGGHFSRCQDARDTASRWNWTFWRDVVRGLVREISAKSALHPALVGPDWSTRVSVDDGTTQVLARRGATVNDLWVIAARRGDGSARVTISGLPRWATTGRVYTERRTVPIESRSLTDTFGQWDVHVYRIARTADVQEPIRVGGVDRRSR
jgi:hypothetical protein